MLSFDIDSFSRKFNTKAAERLVTSNSDKDILLMMTDLYAMAEDEVKTFVPYEDAQLIDCKEGCSTCCRLNVSILQPEAVAIKTFLIDTLKDSELNNLKKNLKELYKHIEFLDEEERIFANKPCAFLNDHGGCGIYHVRPFLCRSMTSSDVNACKDNLSLIAIDESPPVPINTRQKLIMDVAFKALAKAMDDNNQSSKSIGLTGGVLALL